MKWDGTHVATSAVMLALLLAMCFIPAYPGAGYDVRGNGEMFSLNGPSWSLFFEYIGNILYALFIHRLSNKALTGIGHTARFGTVLVCFVRCGRLWHDRGGLDARQTELLGRYAENAVSFYVRYADFKKFPVRSRFEAHSGFAALSCWDFSVCLISKVSHRYA